MKTNKEVTQILYKYFLEQDPKDVARTCAGMMVDMVRMVTVELLPEDEAELLCLRIEHNANQVKLLLKGHKKGLTVTNVESVKEMKCRKEN